MSVLEEGPTLKASSVGVCSKVSCQETSTLGVLTDACPRGCVPEVPTSGMPAQGYPITCPAFVADREEPGAVG